MFHSYNPGYQKGKIRQEEYISSGSSNSNIWDELNFEKAKTLKLSHLDILLWNKIKRVKQRSE